MRKQVSIAAVILVAIAGVALVVHRLQNQNASIEGVTLLQNADAHRQVPISDVLVTAVVRGASVRGRSDAAGFFRLTLPGLIWHSETVDLQFRHAGYQPLDITQPLRDDIYVIRMSALAATTSAAGPVPQTPVKDVRVRYATKATMPVNVGSVARTFEVVNTGNVPCTHGDVCSPDGNWKAAIGGLTLDAGGGHQFRDVRVSCIAGPCPFTRTEPDQVSGGGQLIKLSVRNWSDTATFLVEAEVIQTMLSDIIRNAYPAIFGREMSFTLPPAAQGPSIEADMNGNEIVYPLGPALSLSWADCRLQMAPDRTRLYRCELRSGFRFQ